MTQQQYIISRKLNILELGKTLGNISEACRRLGVSRQHYYDIKQAIEDEGLDGLLEKSRQAPRIGNRVAPEIEQKVLDYSLQYPTHGQFRTANELKQQGIIVSGGGVRSIWLRYDLQTKGQRLKRLEKWATENLNILTESQIKALESAKERDEACGEVESPHPAFLTAQDTYYVGTIKGIGRIYQQTGIDTHCNPAPWHPPAPAGGGKRFHATSTRSVARKQFREVALFVGASGSCRRGLHSRLCQGLYGTNRINCSRLPEQQGSSVL